MSIVSILVFLGILVAVNYLGTRQNKRWDFTANQVYSLSDQTVKILRELKEPVHVHRLRAAAIGRTSTAIGWTSSPTSRRR